MNKNIIIIGACVVVAVVIIVAAVAMTNGDSKDDPKPEVELIPVTVAAYNMAYMPYDPNDEHYYDKPKPVSDYKVGDFQFMIQKGQDEILYTTFETFASLYSNDIVDGYTPTVTDDGKTAKWTVKDKDGKEVCSITFDIENKTFGCSGDAEQFVKNLYKNTLTEQTKFQVTKVEDKGSEVVRSYEGFGLDPVVKDGKTYFPMGLLSVSFQQDISRMFMYSSKDKMLFEYSTSEQMECSFILGEDENATIKGIVSKSYLDQYAEGGESTKLTLPKYMVEHTKNLIYFIMDKCYGLAGVLGYKSMADYLDNTIYSDKFLSEKPKEYAEAYSVALSLLNDGHTGYSPSLYLFEGTGLGSKTYYQTLLKDRTSLYKMLNDERESELKKTDSALTDVRYSDDGKTAYFSFNGFSAARYYSETMPEDERLTDTYYLFVKNLNEIKAKGGVERVVIDETTNGGGYVLIMGKLMALLSKTNNADMYMKNDITGTVMKYSVQVDSNNDGVYDTNDCFGQYFKFYIVTSSYSFSCGNAFPFYAKNDGIAQLVGTRTGGGECSVESVLLPFGQTIIHSSDWHIGSYNAETKVFTGDEEGASPMLMPTFSLYDVNKMSEYLKGRE